ncbi:MAG: HlyD family secretion protein [Chthoniobacter sp.]|jgi:RND family efflux transporter MFP subunit|nr:HlyD family secretion protein [Chthoniobacter sp.]
MKKLLILLLLALVAGGGWYVYELRNSTQEKLVVPDKFVAKAEKRDIDASIEVSGDVTPAFQLEVKPEVGGKLKALHVEPGDQVKEGALLVEIDDRDLISEKESALTEIEGAKLEMEKTGKNYERAKELFEQKLISTEVYDNLSSEYAIDENSLVKAQRKLQLVEDRLRKTKVLAPMDGTVLTVPVIEGQVVIAAASVNSGTSLMTLANLSKLLVETHINQVDVARLEPNQLVKLHAESLKDTEMDARVSFIAPVATVKNNVKGFQVQALIDKPSSRLRPGMTVNMTVPIASASDVVSVPISAVFKGEGNKKVIYVRIGETTERREVKIGVTNTDFAQVLKGVEAGEEILLVEPDRAARKKS